MTYRIEINLEVSWADSIWIWKVFRGDSDEVLHHGSSAFRWSGLWAAGRWCEKHRKGKVRPVDTGERTVYYEV